LGHWSFRRCLGGCGFSGRFRFGRRLCWLLSGGRGRRRFASRHLLFGRRAVLGRRICLGRLGVGFGDFGFGLVSLLGRIRRFALFGGLACLFLGGSGWLGGVIRGSWRLGGRRLGVGGRSCLGGCVGFGVEAV
jgi:hypothetical protein